MAGLWKLPCIFLCENNKYAMGTSVERASQNIEFYKRGDLIPGIRANGMSIFTVREIFKMLKQYSAVEDKGPVFLELNTYRYHGHSMSDPGLTYRSREEVAEVRKTIDPILQIKNMIIEFKVASEDKLKEIEETIKDRIDKEVE